MPLESGTEKIADERYGIQCRNLSIPKDQRAGRIGRHDFRCTTDLEGLPNDQAQAVTELASMLYLRDDVRIARAAYALMSRLDRAPRASHQPP